MDYTKPFKYISEIAHYHSISTAAEKLNIQQPALSKYLKKVENELGAELFDRSTNPITLTSAGESYIKTARKIIDADNQLQKQIADIHNNEVSVRVGISPSRAPYLLPRILKQYFNDCSGAKIKIIEGTTDELNTGLLHGELDLIINVEDNGTKDFERVELFNESVLLAVAKSCKDYSFTDVFRKLDIISSGRGQMLTDILDTMPKHNSVIECQNTITALELVRANIGAALVPSYMADYGNIKDLNFIKLPKQFTDHVQRTVCIFYRKEQFLSSAEKAFIRSSVYTTKTKS